MANAVTKINGSVFHSRQSSIEPLPEIIFAVKLRHIVGLIGTVTYPLGKVMHALAYNRALVVVRKYTKAL
jgi:hypothetical protein